MIANLSCKRLNANGSFSRINILIVVNFFAPPAGNPGTASRCLSDLDPAVLRRIRATPSHFYVNVHTAAFPSGAVRGQLF